MGGGSPKVEAPKPTPEEIAIQKEQLEIMRQQRALQDLLLPYELEQLGLKRTDKGLVRMSEEERLAHMTEAERQAYENMKLLQERQAKALRGELPVSPALEDELAKERARLEENLSAKLGPNWMQTTPGQQALDMFNKRAELLREEARRGEISTGTGLILSRMGYMGDQTSANLARMGMPVGAYSGLLGHYAQALEPYQRQRAMEYNAKVQNAMMSANRTAGLLGAIGSVGGMLGGAWLMRR